MSKNSRLKKATKVAAAPAPAEPLSSAWIPMKTGLVVISLVSVLMAVLTAWSAIPDKGWGLGILYGVLFGALIWVVFYVSQAVFRWLKR